MEIPRRFREPTELRWRDPVLVRCPRCSRQASVRELGVPARAGFRSARLLCAHCTLTRSWAGERLHVLLDGKPTLLVEDHGHWMVERTGRYLQTTFEVVDGVDARFGVPLWLTTTCCGGKLLWANNTEHLDYLSAYLGATLRERPAPPSTLSWRLPAWMKDAKHRDEILRAVDRLRATVAP